MGALRISQESCIDVRHVVCRFYNGTVYCNSIKLTQREAKHVRPESSEVIERTDQ